MIQDLVIPIFVVGENSGIPLGIPILIFFCRLVDPSDPKKIACSHLFSEDLSKLHVVFLPTPFFQPKKVV